MRIKQTTTSNNNKIERINRKWLACTNIQIIAVFLDDAKGSKKQYSYLFYFVVFIFFHSFKAIMEKCLQIFGNEGEEIKIE